MTDDRQPIVRRTPFPPSTSEPVVTPLSPTVVWASDDPDDLDRQYEEGTGYTYSREGHPNADVLATKLDGLEGVAPGSGIVTGSGMSAIGAAVLALVGDGDHVVGGHQSYGRTLRLLTDDLPRMGIETSLVDTTDAAAVAAALRPETRLVLVETMANPTLRVADIDGITEACAGGPLVLVDNTFATPRGFRPFGHGADLVVESVTKLLSGHSDVTLGYVAARDPEVTGRLRTAGVTWGLTPSPFDCWLAERGLQTFELRYDRAESTAVVIADALAAMEGVESVVHPGRADHPDHRRSRELLGDRTGTMVTFTLTGGRPEANAFVRAAEPIPFAPTLGDVATMISHPASSSHRALTPDARAALGITEGTIRLSLGIEDPAVLLPTLTTAVAAAVRTQGS